MNSWAACATRGSSARWRAVSCAVADPGRLGRVLRDGAGDPRGVVEAADYDGADGPAEINAGQYVFDAAWLWRTLPAVPVSARGEYYLTHLVAMASELGTPGATAPADAIEALGVDDRLKLAEAGRRYAAACSIGTCWPASRSATRRQPTSTQPPRSKQM
ncbi:MAG: hypothetical protein IPI33_06965 [Dehalococcoidia bacterium]|nr:hypothetical protein [Dehalococcoidia bacterium]